MLLHTRGIAIKNTRYGESSLISKVYTRSMGMQSYMINSVRSPKAAIKPSLLQPLVLLDMVVYHNKVKNLQRIRELKARPPLKNLHFDIVKSTIGLYMSELLHRSIREEEPNESLFDFLEYFIYFVDGAEQPTALLPLYFSLKLSAYLGFYPQDNYSAHSQVFDLMEGKFMEQVPNSEPQIEPDHAAYLSLLINTEERELSGIHIPKESRLYLLNKMSEYYRLHLPGFQPLKSLPVLSAVLRG